MRSHTLLPVFVVLLFSTLALTPSLRAEDNSKWLSNFLEAETNKCAESTVAAMSNLETWKQKKPEYVQQLQQMLGLSPWPKRTPLNAKVTATHKRDGVIVENISFESKPGLYVTGNFYRPETQTERLPAILYVCGHARVSENGISYGNKVSYHHHGVLFAKNGYVCLTIDTIQLGEIEGLHHGTYREGMWWWHNRGYTPAGVEAWNGIRSLDYLESRPEVDSKRFGMTGRSGGGAYTWWVAALDERIAAAVPVAGITSLQNHVIDDCIEGHCDCMYQVNTYQWDFPMVAALIAPRPLLISNTDKDSIFPLDGVVDVYMKTRHLYELYGQLDHIGLNITEGPHKDTQRLQVSAFHWFNRFLKGEDQPIESVAEKMFTKEELKVFDTIPADERTSTIHESFIPVPFLQIPQSKSEQLELADQLRSGLLKTSFRNWPNKATDTPIQFELVRETKSDGLALREFKLMSDASCSLPVFVIQRDQAPSPTTLEVVVCDDSAWSGFASEVGEHFPEHADVNVSNPAEKRSSESGTNVDVSMLIQALKESDSSNGEALVFFAPRALGASEWPSQVREATHAKRRLALLGHTLDSLRVFDIVEACEGLHQQPDFANAELTLRGPNHISGVVTTAALMSSLISRVDLPSADEISPPELLMSDQVVSFDTLTKLVTLTKGQTENK
ncbi:Acetyl xylan esterase (AXE1) [Thalassoglobus neptunius]|uniref:Acetyl xylan esterase (AXE1) n=1 Tax=Thalassoglobus neptunius TaxID=1938619 RepID=A0A5C5WN34_9PLAN|nr:acetylxylan esterase [Thalassoglobus neptunius]TWT51511.1 Acetyl xylan esterase (AXE1) [Thalassoglobus neptunius]